MCQWKAVLLEITAIVFSWIHFQKVISLGKLKESILIFCSTSKIWAILETKLKFLMINIWHLNSKNKKEIKRKKKKKTIQWDDIFCQMI